MRAFLFRLSPWLASRRSLTARGQFLTTFAGLGFAVALFLLALGGYLIEEQFSDPVQAGAAGLLFAAVLLATAFTLLYCLVHPSRKLGRHGGKWMASPGEPGTVAVAASNRETVVVARADRDKRTAHGSHWPLHGRYVDRARVHIRR